MTDTNNSYETHTPNGDTWITVKLTVAEWNLIRRQRKTPNTSEEM